MHHAYYSVSLLETYKSLFEKKPTFRSPEILAPAKIPVAAGKNTAKTEKKLSPSLNCGVKLSKNTEPRRKIKLKSDAHQAMLYTGIICCNVV
jgi:hypothetical protein